MFMLIFLTFETAQGVLDHHQQLGKPCLAVPDTVLKTTPVNLEGLPTYSQSVDRESVVG